MYSHNSSSIAIILSLILLEIIPACFFCNNNFNLRQSSSRSHDQNVVFETLEAEIVKPGNLSDFIRVLSRADLLL